MMCGFDLSAAFARDLALDSISKFIRLLLI